MSNGKLLGISIDVTKISKDRLYEGKNGAKYASFDIWINDEEDQYGNHASVTERQSKEERDAKAKKNYVGNGKKVFGWDDAPASRPATAANVTADTDDGEIPF
jgi:hypothetical protein